MLIRHLHGPVGRDLRVRVADPDATVADLIEALEPHAPIGPLLVDERLVSAATPLDLAGIGDGATVRRPPDPSLPPPPGRPDHLVTVTATAGPDAGRRVVLGPGTHLIGRAGARADGALGAPSDPAPAVALHDPTVSRRHAWLVVTPAGTVQVADAGSTNGTWVDGEVATDPRPVAPGAVLCCGASQLEVAVGEPPEAATSPPVASGARTTPHHRPPRPDPPRPAAPVELPPPPGPPPPLTPVGAVAVLASLAVGAVMVVALHSWSYAAFALLGPVLVLANAADSRRRRRRHRRRAGRQRARELHRLGAALRDAQRQERVVRAAAAPGPAAVALVAARRGPTCWERRLHHPDAATVRVGTGRVAWDPPVAGAAPPPADDVAGVLRDHALLHDAPIALALEPGWPVAVVGPSDVGRGLVRSIVVQAVVEHGPADLRVGLLAAADRAGAWDWCAWLPHATDPAHGSLLAGDAPRAQSVVDGLRPPSAEGPPSSGRTVVIVDDPPALASRRSAARSLLRLAVEAETGVVPVVLVDRAVEVPAACRVVLTVTADGTLTAPTLADGPATVVGTSEVVARGIARDLARLDDPEANDPGHGLPTSVALTDLLGAERVTAAGMGAAWRAGGADPAPRAVLGTSVDGRFEVDLALDGPHALVAGTTGAGKSELLRTLVASLAATSSPDHLTFVLIDFKGGSAFDACARLPHTTGLVTDLDDHLARRALQCLEAELRHRERRLRAAGAEDLADLRRRCPTGEPLPRLVVVIDEFATLAAELPDFVESLVGVAQRGRSLGVHLVLATQRPSGAVSERIRANTALRVALRVQSTGDSTDVIDAPGAATLPRRSPGRALVRLGPGELVAVQVARATTPRPEEAMADTDADTDAVRSTQPVRPPRAAVAVAPLGVASGEEHAPAADHHRDGGARDALAGDGRSALDALVDAAVEAWRVAGGRPPRRPWPDPLPEQLGWPVEAADHVDLPEVAGPALVVGLADHPEEQRRTPWAWRLADGPLLAVGLPGSGTTTLAATAVLAAARRWGPTSCHVHVVDLGAGQLRALAGLPHVGAVVGADDLERQRRLLADLTQDLATRRAAGDRGGVGPSEAPPRRLVVVDGIGAFRARWPDLDPSATWERLLSLVADGSGVGIHVLLTAEGVGAAPHHVVAACRQRLVFRLGERADHGSFGIPASAVPHLPPGRAVAADGPHLVQVARPAGGLASAVAHLAGEHGAASVPDVAPVGVLPHRIDLADLAGLADPTGGNEAQAGPPSGTLRLPLGVADEGLARAVLALAPGAHALVAGPPRSGRTSTLQLLALGAHEQGVAVVVVAPDASPWADVPVEHRAPTEDLADLRARSGPLLVLVDDADRTDDDHPVLTTLATERRPDRHVVAAGRADRLRSLYGHWTREVRADRTGVLLWPDPDLDGDLLGVRLPRHAGGITIPGRGWAGGTVPEGLVQVARQR